MLKENLSFFEGREDPLMDRSGFHVLNENKARRKVQVPFFHSNDLYVERLNWIYI